MKIRPFLTTALLSLATLHAGDSPVTVEFNDKGLNTINWNGKNYAAPFRFRLSFMNVDDAGKNSNALGGAKAVTVDPASGTVIADYEGATLSCKYVPDGDRLDLFVEITNKTDKPAMNFGAELLGLNLAKELGNTASDSVGVTRNIDNLGRIGPRRLEADGASIILSNWEIAPPKVVVNVGSASPSGPYPLTMGLPEPVKPRHPVVDAKFFPPQEFQIPPATTEKYHFSLTFSDPSTSTAELSKEMNARLNKLFPMKFQWDDRRLIGTLFLANPNTNWKTNPRGYLPGKGKDNDVTTEEGLEAFGQALMAYADKSVEILKKDDAQGVIVWDLEGAEHYHPITYIAQPDKLKAIAPEMDRFADAFFKKFSDAGLRTGLTLRPTEVVPDPKKPSKWTHVEVKDPVKLISDKIAYAKNRWGCTLFYLDSNVFANDFLTPEQRKEMKVPWIMPVAMIEQLHEAHPDVLIIPEWPGRQYELCSAPYSSVNLGALGSSAAIRSYRPESFRIVSTNSKSLQENWDNYLETVGGGDILLFNAWYETSEIPLIRLLKEEILIIKHGPPEELKGADLEGLKAQMTQTDNLRVQYYAIERLIELGDPRSVELLVPLLDSPVPFIQKKALIALAKLKGAGSPELAEKIAMIIRDPKAKTLARFAAITLGNLGPAAHPEILALLQDGKKPDLVGFGLRAAKSLPESSPEISAAVLEIFQTSPPQEDLIQVIGALKIREAVPKLIELLDFKKRDDEGLSRDAVAALGNIGDPSAIQPILGLYKRGFSTMAVYSIRGVQNEALKKLTDDKDSRTADEWRAFIDSQAQ